jgi:hypothetical protein
LVEGVILETIDCEMELLWDGGKGGSFQTELDEEGAELIAVSTVFLKIWDLL